MDENSNLKPARNITNPDPEFGIIVNDIQPDPDQKAFDDHLVKLDEARINLRVSPKMFDRLYGLARHQNKEIEDYCVEVLTESLESTVGAPTISGPSSLGGQPVKRVTGPSYATKDFQ
jgi:hypothetical protein